MLCTCQWYIFFYFSFRLTGWLFTLSWIESTAQNVLISFSSKHQRILWHLLREKWCAHRRWITVTKFARNKTLMSIELNSSVGCLPNNRWQLKRVQIPWNAHTQHIIIVHHITFIVMKTSDAHFRQLHLANVSVFADDPINLEHNTFHIVSHLFGYEPQPS